MLEYFLAFFVSLLQVLLDIPQNHHHSTIQVQATLKFTQRFIIIFSFALQVGFLWFFLTFLLLDDPAT